MWPHRFRGRTAFVGHLASLGLKACTPLFRHRRVICEVEGATSS